MVYTTYFAKLRKLPKDIIPICIARVLPPKVDMLRCPLLEPTSKMLYNYKYNNEYNKIRYKEDYYNLILNGLNPNDLIVDLIHKTGSLNIALVCYEKSDSFCHRHLVAEWLNNNGIKCEEWKEK